MHGIHVLVSGFVQGVNFRYYTMQHAKSLKLKGGVKNILDGKVEIVAQGSKQDLEKMIDWLSHGPSSASIDNVSVRWYKPTKNFKKFSILR